MKKRTIRKLCVAAVVLVLFIGAAGYAIHASAGQNQETYVYKEETVKRGDIVSGVTESGSIDLEQSSVTFDVEGNEEDDSDSSSDEEEDDEDDVRYLEIEKVYVVSGQRICAGDPLFSITEKSRQSVVRKLESALAQKEKKLNEIRNREIGFIFQNYQLIPTYNIMQNIIMPLLVRGMTTQQAEEQCKKTIELLGISHRLKHKPNELSGGQKQRVSIARALVGEPALLLADELTGALDSASGKEVLKLFEQLHKMGHTIVMITHDLSVAKHAQRIVSIMDGQLSQKQAELPENQYLQG